MTNAGRSFSVWPAHAVLCTFLAGQHVCMLPLCTYSVLRSSAKALSTVCVKLEGHIIWKVTCQLPRSMSLPYTRNRTVQPANKKHCLRMEHLHTGEQLQTMEPLSWLELAAPAWHNVFAMLHPKDLSSLMMTCRHFRDLANVDLVWQAQCEKWPHDLRQLQLGGYQSHKALVLDDNRRSAVLSVPLQGAVCTYRYQRPSYFFQCRILQLQWWRGTNSLRLFFDVRGETDLRHPITSSLAVVQLKAEQRQAVRHAAGSPFSAAAPYVVEAESTAAATADGPHGSGRVQSHQQLGVYHPDGCDLITDKPGHYKGVLTWESLQCSEILGQLWPGIGQQQQQRTPPEQHRRQQRGRRSQAWEDWADWQLQHEAAGDVYDWGAEEPIVAPPPSAAAADVQDHAAAAAGPDGVGVRPYWFWHVWHAVAGGLGQQGSGSASSYLGDAAMVDAPRGLLFCYANDLSVSTDDSVFMYGQPDYTSALLVTTTAPSAHGQHALHSCNRSVTAAVAAATMGSSGPAPAAIQATAAGAAAGAAVGLHSRPGTPDQGGSLGHVAGRPENSLALPSQVLKLPVQLHSEHEPHWVKAWLELPGASVVQRGLADKQLREESEADEKARWADLPMGVKRRGASWWK